MASTQTKPQPSSTLSHTPIQLTRIEKLQFLVFLTYILTKSLLQILIRHLFTHPFTRRTFRQTTLITLAQNIQSPLLTQRQLLSPQDPTGTTVEKYCSKHNLVHDAINVPQPATFSFPPPTLHLIAPSTSHQNLNGDIILYFHGGGYIFPLSPSHLTFSLRLQKAAQCRLAILEYTLGPDLVYPGQLAQAATAINYLLNTKGYSPQQVIIAGDSAGGNLCLGILAHLHTPHPDIPRIVYNPQGGEKEVQLKGALLISPRCSNTASAPSYIFNNGKDVILPATMDLFAEAYNSNIHEVCATPLNGDRGFWGEVVGKCVRRVLFVTGGDEVYLDDIRKMAGLMGWDGTRGNGDGDEKVLCEIAEGEVHAQAVIDAHWGVEGRMLEMIIALVRRL
ncbi:Alpha/Beta hydrolase protein [Tricladium varicosporioides]|nr:Alpha/Beta hydrolase protein [Hymenoscyphus varicosporioides]